MAVNFFYKEDPTTEAILYLYFLLISNCKKMKNLAQKQTIGDN